MRYTWHPFSQKSDEDKYDNVSGKWIYIFKDRIRGHTSIYAEIYVDHNGDYYQVPWNRRDELGLAGKDKREASVGPKSMFRFTINLDRVDELDFYIFISDIQLPIKRINEYNRSHEALSHRGVVFLPWLPAIDDSMSVLKNNPAFDVYFVPDYIAIAKASQKRYLEAVNDYNDYLTRPETKTEAKKRYMADIIHDVVESEGDSDTIKRLVRWEDLNDFRENRDTIARVSEQKIERYCRHKTDIMKNSRYKETRKDYDGSVEAESEIQSIESYLLEGNLVAKSGKEYLRHIAKNYTWYYRYFFAEQPFQFWTKSIKASNAATSLMLKFLVGRTMVHASKVRIDAKPDGYAQSKIVEDIDRIIERRQNIVPELDLVKNEDGKYLWTEGVTSESPYNSIGYKAKKSIRHVNGATSALLLPLTLVNLGSSMSRFADDSESLVKRVKLAESVGDTIGIIGKLSKTYGDDIAIEIAEKPFAAFSVVSSLIDFFSGLFAAIESFDEGKLGVGWGHTALALSATMGVAAGGLTIWGATTTVVGAFGVIGAIAAAVGIFLIWYFAERPFQDWLESCYWSKSFRVKAFKKKSLNDRIGALDRQIAGLNKVLAEFDATCEVWVIRRQERIGEGGRRSKPIKKIKGFRLRIEPGLFDISKSKFDIKFSARYKRGLVKEEYFLDKDGVEMDTRKDKRFKFSKKNDRIESIYAKWTFYELGWDFTKTSREWGKYLEYKLQIDMDFGSDGTPDKGSERWEDAEWTEMDLPS